MSDQKVKVYEFPNWALKNGGSIYGWLRHYNLNPSWGNWNNGIITIELSRFDADCLLLMAENNPARFGNKSTIEETIKKYQ